LKDLYSDFGRYIAQYFGLPFDKDSHTAAGFATLFSGDYRFNVNDGEFESQQFLDVAGDSSTNQEDNPTVDGAFQDNLSGEITLSNITELLRFIVANNTFKNRNTKTGATASDPNDAKNYGVSDGFFDGDLLFIPDAGFEIALNLKVQAASFGQEGVENGQKEADEQDADGLFFFKIRTSHLRAQVDLILP
jgi:hypothetical protein